MLGKSAGLILFACYTLEFVLQLRKKKRGKPESVQSKGAIWTQFSVLTSPHSDR